MQGKYCDQRQVASLQRLVGTRFWELRRRPATTELTSKNFFPKLAPSLVISPARLHKMLGLVRGSQLGVEFSVCPLGGPLVI
jgi:hypothetical protein